MNKNFREFFYHYFVTERYLNNTPYRMFSLNCNQHSKARKEHAWIKCFFDKVLTISLYCKDMVKPDYIKGVQKQAFAKSVSAMTRAAPPPLRRKFPLVKFLRGELPWEKSPRGKSHVENFSVSFSQIIFVENIFLFLKIWFFNYEGDYHKHLQSIVFIY